MVLSGGRRPGGRHRTRRENSACVISLGVYNHGQTHFRRWEKELTKREHKMLATLARERFNMTDAFQDKKQRQRSLDPG